MTPSKAVPGEKPLFWVGSSRTDLIGFPEAVKDNSASPTAWPSLAERFQRAIYVLHAFQKKIPEGLEDGRDGRRIDFTQTQGRQPGLRGTLWRSIEMKWSS